MDCVFQNTDFTYCYFPVPENYAYAQTHVGVSHVDKGLGEYNLILTTSPYPNPKYGIIQRIWRFLQRKIFQVTFHPSDYYENPLLYFASYSNRSLPQRYVPFIKNPLTEAPFDKYVLGAYNSDPDVYVDNNEIYILNRCVYRLTKVKDGIAQYETNLQMFHVSYDSQSTNFVIHAKVQDLGTVGKSPSIVYYKNRYRIFELFTESYNTGKDCEEFTMRISDKIEGPFSETESINIQTDEYQPWHMSVFTRKDDLYAIVACVKRGQPFRCYQMLGKFNESLTELKIYSTPLTGMSSYRGAAFVDNEDNFVFYNSIIEPSYKKYSVDGREILVAKKTFEEVLNVLSE